MSQQVKVYYVENRATKEIRKFTLEKEVSGNFEYVAAKIRRAFPDLLRKDIDVFWKDEEEEYVTISSDGELYQALEFVYSNTGSNGLLKLYVKVKPQKGANGDTTEEPKEHPGVTCDGCNTSVRGIRFKCTQCYDFDLCSDCESRKVHPSDHEMICIKLPRTSGHFMRNPAFARGNRRGPCGRGGPFRKCGGFGGRSPFAGMFHPFGFPPHHGFPPHQRQGCSPNHPPHHAEGEETKECPKEQQQQQDFKNAAPECIRVFASTLGFDPDVATDYFEAYFGEPQCKNEETDKKTQEKKANQEDIKQSEAVDTEAKAENGVDFQEETTLESNSEEPEKPNEDAPMEEDVTPTVESDTPKSESKDKENEPELQNELREMVGVFAKQFGLTPEAQTNVQGGLDSLLQGMFSQPFQQSNTSDKKEQNETGTSTEPNAPEEFLLVDQEKDGSSSNLSEDEKYQQRLEKAMKQMEAMGFDNDGGWLKQLLISKDLNIGRVLDSVNPSL